MLAGDSIKLDAEKLPQRWVLQGIAIASSVAGIAGLIKKANKT
jgi:hypothetical protein